jgi:hypothetical protein
MSSNDYLTRAMTPKVIRCMARVNAESVNAALLRTCEGAIRPCFSLAAQYIGLGGRTR